MRLLLTATIAILTATPLIFAQNSYDKLPKVAEAGLAEQIGLLQTTDPTISVAALVAYANKRLAERGYDFTVDPCDMKTIATTIKFPSEDREFFHVYKAKDLAGKAQNFLAREPGDAPCGCWLNLPVTSVNRGSLVLKTESGSLKLKPPSQFMFEEIYLMDATLRNQQRVWVVPNGGPPDAISIDGTKLYVEIERESPVLLEISPDGKLKAVPKTAAGIITKYTDLTKFPKDKDNDYLGFRRFTSGRKTYTVKFSHVCT